MLPRQQSLLDMVLWLAKDTSSLSGQGLKKRSSRGRGVMSESDDKVERNMDNGSSSTSHLALPTDVPLEDTKAVVALIEHPHRTQPSSKKNIAGTFEPFSIDPAHFESQLRHFRKHGYAADPLHPHRITGLVPQHEEEGRAGSGDQAKLNQGSGDGKKTKKSKVTDVTSEDWMGPWAKTEEHDAPSGPTSSEHAAHLHNACCEHPHQSTNGWEQRGCIQAAAWRGAITVPRGKRGEGRHGQELHGRAD